jgi:FAD/FMN-containing dehydrogenase
VNEQIIEKLKEIVGSEHVGHKDFQLVAYSRTWSYEKARLADVIVVPGSTKEVSEIVKLCNASNTPVCVRGGGTTTTGMPLPREGGIVLDLCRMDNIKDIDEDAMAVTMQSGISVYKMIKTIEKAGWKIPLKPEFGSGVPIGGWVAFNGVGSGGSVYGRVGDFVIGVEVVLPTGEIVTTGSTCFSPSKQFARSVGAGSDLTGIFLHSLGVTGIITGVTLRLYRMPEVEAFIAYGFQTAEEAQQAVILLMRANISYGINIYDDHMCNVAMLEPPAPYVMHMFAEGWKEEVDFRLRKGREILAKAGLGKEMPEAIPILWGSAEATSAKSDPPVRVACVGGFHPLGITADLFHAYNRIGDKYGFCRGMVWWVANNYANLFPIYLYAEETELEKIIQACTELREDWSNLGCAPDFPGPNPDITSKITPDYFSFFTRIKKCLDPKNILHRGMSPKVHY